ncbi:TIGR02530 family flagellar biosynthesis protein [Halarsenatibacter silvermanii]|uniref:Flagellar operon protein n=1 Tax=Halarsenatibacter silvermanii TaxID=321763 RepID=A0A1G9MJJ9_9FIRM|nr:TIGR02530 family flagellar biosynthesis protein [Halarsenatibacter silvermanii]SDL73815.1 flagellar operon protein [Halarsenatibacter silvermanii]
MDDRMMVNQPIQRPGSAQPTRQDQTGREVEDSQADFGEILEKRLEEKDDIEFSRHARERLESRGINITPRTLNRLQEGLEKAADKGAQESLIMVDDTAYIVSVENKTVITAVDEANVRENVFTDIDSAVLM